MKTDQESTAEESTDNTDIHDTLVKIGQAMTLLFLLPIVIPEIREQAMDAVMAQAPTTVALSILTLCGGIAVVYHLFKK